MGFRIEFNIDLGTARKEFFTLIERDGQIIDYDELSGGEKQLVNVAMAFAMNESLTMSKGINLAFLDEVFESLSSDNVEVVTSLIRHTFADNPILNYPFRFSSSIKYENPASRKSQWPK